MSDSAFKSAPYASYTTAQLREWIAEGTANDIAVAEVARREMRDACFKALSAKPEELAAMTGAERLRFYNLGGRKDTAK